MTEKTLVIIPLNKQDQTVTTPKPCIVCGQPTQENAVVTITQKYTLRQWGKNSDNKPALVAIKQGDDDVERTIVLNANYCKAHKTLPGLVRFFNTVFVKMMFALIGIALITLFALIYLNSPDEEPLLAAALGSVLFTIPVGGLIYLAFRGLGRAVENRFDCPTWPNKGHTALLVDIDETEGKNRIGPVQYWLKLYLSNPVVAKQIVDESSTAAYADDSEWKSWQPEPQPGIFEQDMYTTTEGLGFGAALFVGGIVAIGVLYLIVSAFTTFGLEMPWYLLVVALFVGLLPLYGLGVILTTLIGIQVRKARERKASGNPNEDA